MIERRLVELGIDILTRHQLAAVKDGAVEFIETLKGATVTLNGSLVTVTARLPRDELYYALTADPNALAEAGVQSVRRIGDCHGPATIAAAVYEGHRYARELDTDPDPDAVPFKRERFDLDSV
jgi:dimethylamine/trimethylamine dehydrogenase